MADLPILFSAPMVRALIAGTKTQTRRIIKPQPFESGYFDGEIEVTVIPANDQWPKAFRFNASAVGGDAVLGEIYEPRISAGDRLYVREAWRVSKFLDGHSPANSHKGKPILKPQSMTVFFDAGGSIANQKEVGDWKPDTWPQGGFPDWVGKTRQAMHLPRWGSRITLLVDDVKIERLQDISEEDAIAEGIEWNPRLDPVGQCKWRHYGKDTTGIYPPSASYGTLWDSINGAGSWDADPWVVAYTFRRVMGNIDTLPKVAA